MAAARSPRARWRLSKGRPGERALVPLGRTALACAALLSVGWVRGFDDPDFVGSPFGVIDLILGVVAFFGAVSWVLGDSRWGRLTTLAAFAPAAFSYVVLSDQPWGVAASGGGLVASAAGVWLDARRRAWRDEDRLALVLLLPASGVGLSFALWLLVVSIVGRN